MNDTEILQKNITDYILNKLYSAKIKTPAFSIQYIIELNKNKIIIEYPDNQTYVNIFYNDDIIYLGKKNMDSIFNKVEMITISNENKKQYDKLIKINKLIKG